MSRIITASTRAFIEALGLERMKQICHYVHMIHLST